MILCIVIFVALPKIHPNGFAMRSAGFRNDSLSFYDHILLLA